VGWRGECKYIHLCIRITIYLSIYIYTRALHQSMGGGPFRIVVRAYWELRWPFLWVIPCRSFLLYCFLFTFGLSVLIGRLDSAPPLRRTPVGREGGGGVIPMGKESRRYRRGGWEFVGVHTCMNTNIHIGERCISPWVVALLGLSS